MKIIKHGYEELEFNKEELELLRQAIKLLSQIPLDTYVSEDMDIEIDPTQLENTIDTLVYLRDYSLQTPED